MKKTTSIRLFLVLAAVVCSSAYGGGYYYSVHQSEERIAREQELRARQLMKEREENGGVQESAVAVAAFEFILCEEDGYVVVYCADRETLYDNTDIPMQGLSPELQRELRKGKPIYSEAELYNFLESHSS